MKKRIVTISRQFGSGGRTVGKRVAQALGVPCYDSELLEKIAEKSGFAKEYVKEQGEYARGGLASIFTDRTQGLTNQDKLWAVQKQIILDLAEKESCVIVGRCADYILRDREDCLKVFIHASMEKRAERIVKEYGEREESPEQRLKEKDKRRAAYYRFYTDVKWGRAENYDIALDSGRLGLDKCAELILQSLDTEKE